MRQQGLELEFVSLCCGGPSFLVLTLAPASFAFPLPFYLSDAGWCVLVLYLSILQSPFPFHSLAPLLALSCYNRLYISHAPCITTS